MILIGLKCYHRNVIIINQNQGSMEQSNPGHWLSCDWGSSILRLRLIENDSLRMLEEVKINKGISEVYDQWKKSGKSEDARIEFYYKQIGEQIAFLENNYAVDLKGVPLIISGMASSTIGMIDLPYKILPFATDGSDLETHQLNVDESIHREVLIISGVTSGYDIMRGEETILIGCSDDHIPHEQLYIFPGTHSKHVVVKGGAAISFQTYMTGEFFWLLCDISVLGTGIKKDGRYSDPKNQQAFANGVFESKKKNLLHSCFDVRTNTVLQKCGAEENFFYLSGLLIGTELQNAIIYTYDITIAGDQMFNDAYSKAIQLLNYKGEITLMDANAALVRGQGKIWEKLKIKNVK